MNKLLGDRDYAARLTDVSYEYGTIQALDDVSLEVPTGKITGIIGPDGVGKSTLLSLVAGVRAPQSGTVTVLGGDIGRAEHRWSIYQHLAFMPQGLGRNLYGTLSVHENIDFFARLFGLDRTQRKRRIDWLTESTGLKPFQDRPAENLSGGMKQKLGLCCALVHVPDLLILDEPTTGVDPLSRQQFWALIDRMREQHTGLSVLASTAYMPEADRFDRLIALNEGKVIGRGDPGEILDETGTDTLDEAFVALLPGNHRIDEDELRDRPEPTTGDETAIEASHLTKQFDGFTAVDDVSFTIHRGEIFGFIGPNGSGKTTTMKMMTGLLTPTEGTATIFGQSVDAYDLSVRDRVGYMAQDFSLYEELSVHQNLRLHARLYRMDESAIDERIDELLEQFDLHQHEEAMPDSLPVGQRQRLSLAVAMVHDPELLILDEPTSGVDPLARNDFWKRLIGLSRDQGVTIFISTHYMSEAGRCDRISLMHQGKTLATDSPGSIVDQQGTDTLEEAFVNYIEAASPEDSNGFGQGNRGSLMEAGTDGDKRADSSNRFLSPARLASYAWRESVELWRDPVRLTMALLGSVILLFVMGYGISLDVDNLTFSVLDWDQTVTSREYRDNISGSPYFVEKVPIRGYDGMERRLRSGELGLALEIPPDFAADLARGRPVEIGGWVDASMPQRAETIRGYVRGMHSYWLNRYLEREGLSFERVQPITVETRFRYNPNVESLVAIVPGVIPLLLVLIPAMMMALSLVREKERGTIVNFYLTPSTRLEFIVGKQVPYVVLSLASLVMMIILAVTVFGVPLKGNPWALLAGGFLYVIGTTALGLLMSSFMKSQVAAIFSTAVLTMIPAIQYSGLITPVESLEGFGRWIGTVYPTTYFLQISRAVFAKGLGFGELTGYFWPLCLIGPGLILITALFLGKQET